MISEAKSIAELKAMFEDLVAPTILVVDDDRDIRNLICTALEGFNVEIVTAKHGGEAVHTIKNYHVDLVLLDLMMPVLNGYEVLEWLDLHDTDLPTVILTGDPTNPLVLKALTLGPVLLMQKPWTIRAFRKVMNYVPFAKAREYAPAT